MNYKFALVEDHASVAEAISYAIETTHSMCCVGSYRTLETARRGLIESPPDLVVLDWRVGSDTGPDLVADVFPTLPKIRWLLYTGTPDIFVIRHAMRCGVSSVVSKGQPLAALLRGVKDTSDGRSFFCEESSRAFGSIFHLPAPPCCLNDTELKIVDGIAQGMEPKEVASTIGLAHKTVHNGLSTIRQKLGINSMVAIANWAILHGLGTHS